MDTLYILQKEHTKDQYCAGITIYDYCMDELMDYELIMPKTEQRFASLHCVICGKQ